LRCAHLAAPKSLKNNTPAKLARILLFHRHNPRTPPPRRKETRDMEDQNTSLIARDDTFFGVCQGIGEDFGFNPLYLRVALGVALLVNPPVVLGTYAVLGALVLLSRLLFPNPRIAPAAVAARAVEAPAQALAEPAQAELDKVSRQLLPLAA
jgi:phage shock protein PspC (stress-responsive transcriptional regulator)